MITSPLPWQLGWRVLVRFVRRFMRYTEGALVWELPATFKDIEKRYRTFAWNFDDTEKEPTVLPAAPIFWLMARRNFCWLCDERSAHSWSHRCSCLHDWSSKAKNWTNSWNFCQVWLPSRELLCRGEMKLRKPMRLERIASSCVLGEIEKAQR